MRVLSITAQKPNSTGSGIYLTALVQQWSRMGHEQAVVAGVYKEDQIQFPEGTVFYPVIYRTEKLPFAVAGMSDEMPYESTRYRDLPFMKWWIERLRNFNRIWYFAIICTY